MSPLWSDMAIASALKAAAKARQAADRKDGEGLRRVGNGWSLDRAVEPARRPIRRRLASSAL